MPRRKILTDERLMSDLQVLAEHADDDGVCRDTLPVEVLRLHHGYEKPYTFYREVRMLEKLGHLATYPPGAVHYTKGYQIVGFNKQEVLQKRLQGVFETLATAALELQGITSELNHLSAEGQEQ